MKIIGYRFTITRTLSSMDTRRSPLHFKHEESPAASLSAHFCAAAPRVAILPFASPVTTANLFLRCRCAFFVVVMFHREGITAAALALFFFFLLAHRLREARWSRILIGCYSGHWWHNVFLDIVKFRHIVNLCNGGIFSQPKTPRHAPLGQLQDGEFDHMV